MDGLYYQGDNTDYKEILDTILDNAEEWVVIVNEKGIITMMSKGYKEFCGDENPEGKYVTEVIENTNLHNIVKTGKAELGVIMKVKDQNMIASRIPIKKNNKIIGALGKVIFKDLSGFYEMSKKVNHMEKELAFYRHQLSIQKTAKYTFSNIKGESAHIQNLIKVCKRASRLDSNILITGESGTGKELFAHSIHNESERSCHPFVKVNCSAIPNELLESELFGYEEGAFTGAKKEGKKGKFELAENGTIFLDEIGDMPLYMQAKLLRVLQEKEIDKVGGTFSKSVNVRIISATNKDLSKEVKNGTFREDLYYRLNVMNIHIEPLRERKEDIKPLALELIKKLSDEMGVYVKEISNEAIYALEEYSWPGNIRELENVIERALNLIDNDFVIKVVHFPRNISGDFTESKHLQKKQLKEILDAVEKETILKSFENNNRNKKKTAQELNISRTNLYAKLKSYEIDLD